MLADLGSMIINTNEIRRIFIQTDPNSDKPRIVFIETPAIKLQALSYHMTEVEAEMQFQRVKEALQSASCLIDLQLG